MKMLKDRMRACSAAMPKPRSFLLHLLLIVSCIANAAGADAAPSQEPTTPSSSFQGEWQLLHASIGVSAMHMQLLPGDFVLMFDRTDMGPSNISLAALAPCATTADGADRTSHSVLLDLRSNVLHPYPLATNPWCSSGALLPNGTLLRPAASPTATASRGSSPRPRAGSSSRRSSPRGGGTPPT